MSEDSVAVYVKRRYMMMAHTMYLGRETCTVRVDRDICYLFTVLVQRCVSF
jgi:hypothetical protein